MAKVNIYPVRGRDNEQTCRVEVGWHPNGDVQIATTLRSVTRQPLWDGQWVDLDRHAINHLIRVLREARDKAYGRDE